MSWKHLKDIFAIRLEDIFKTSLRRFYKTSWRRLEDVWARFINSSWRRLEPVFWKSMTKVNILVLIRTSWRRLPQDVCLLGNLTALILDTSAFRNKWSWWTSFFNRCKKTNTGNFFYTYNKDFIFISHFLDFHEEQEKMAKKWPLYHN